MRRLGLGLFLAVASHCAHADSKAWQDAITLPTWAEGPPDIHPKIDPLDPGSATYPYTTRLNFTTTREPQTWRRLNLENEYMACSFLPDLGGHLYSCTDKRNGKPIFRANPSVKKADIAPRGAWVAMGIELNFPVAHSRYTVSPVNFGVRQEADHAEVWVGGTDLVTGMEWLAQFILRDGSAVLEQHVTLRNATAARHPYLWWANGDIDLDAGTRFVYPTNVMELHGANDLLSWPRDQNGRDLNKPLTVAQQIGLFAYGSREPFFAAYNANTRTAVVHVADPAVVTGKKLFNWGSAGLAWPRQHLSDNDSAYVEIQAGLFPNQTTYEFLPPHQEVQFTELWMSGRDLNGVSRANADAIVSLERVAAAAGKSNLVIGLNVTHAIAGARLAIYSGAKPLWEEKADLSPAKSYEHAYPSPDKAVTYRFELHDAAGKLLLSHTEGAYEAVARSSVKLGPRPLPGPGARRDSAADFLWVGENDEKQSCYQYAEGEYREGLKKFPDDTQLHKALGRLLFSQQRYLEAAHELSLAAQQIHLDPELRYYFGAALAALDKDDEARKSWQVAELDAQFGPPSLAEMAALEVRKGHIPAAMDLLQKAIGRRSSLMAARKLQIALLRHAGFSAAAHKALDEALALDPLDPYLRLEGIHLGAGDESLWSHLGADCERVLDIAETYMSYGLYADALEALSREYPAGPANQSEPGATLPQSNALVSYYRAYCELKLGRDAAADFKLAQTQTLAYVFPHRASSLTVLAVALKSDPRDAAAHFLTGLQFLNDNRPGDAVDEWKAALALRKDIPGIHYLLGRTLLLMHKVPEAISVLREGASLNSSDKAMEKAVETALHPPPPATDSSGAVAAPGSLAAAVKTPATPAGLAMRALLRTADGEAGTINLFGARDFPQEKQPEIVRRAYIEVQLQMLRRGAARKDCAGVLPGVEKIGALDPNIPFTIEGFEPFMKGARFQYFLGAVESLCGETKSAQRRWNKVARMKPEITSADFAFPAIAEQSLAAKGKPFDPSPWLTQLAKALEDEKESKGMLDYSKGILLLGSGDERAAMAAFTEGVQEPDRDFSQYLNQLALVEASRAARR